MWSTRVQRPSPSKETAHAYGEIRTNNRNAAFAGRMRNPVRRPGLDRAGGRAICASTNAAAAAGIESVQPLHGAATELHANRAIAIKRDSRVCGHLTGECARGAQCRSLAPADIDSAGGRTPAPPDRRSPTAAVLFHFLSPGRLRVWLCVAAQLGRILVPNLAVFVTLKRLRKPRGERPACTRSVSAGK